MRGEWNKRVPPQMEEIYLNKKIMTAVIWIALFAAIIYMVSGLNPTDKKMDELDYNTEFLQLVRNTESGSTDGKTILAIQVTQREVYGLYGGSEYEAKDLPKRAEFYVIIPSESTFRADMAAIVFAASFISRPIGFMRSGCSGSRWRFTSARNIASIHLSCWSPIGHPRARAGVDQGKQTGAF